MELTKEMKNVVRQELDKAIDARKELVIRRLAKKYSKQIDEIIALGAVIERLTKKKTRLGDVLYTKGVHLCGTRIELNHNSSYYTTYHEPYDRLIVELTTMDKGKGFNEALREALSRLYPRNQKI